MFASKPPTCTGRTLDLSRKDSDIRYLRHLGNSDIAINFNALQHLDSIGLVKFENLSGFIRQDVPERFTVNYYGRPLNLEMSKDAGNQA